MRKSFRATIYKVGINPCVDVPPRFTSELEAARGYIRVKGAIDGHPFTQTLVPVKDGPYRLYVNGPMLKAAAKTVGQSAVFLLEQDNTPAGEAHPMPAFLKTALTKYKLLPAFKGLTPYRQKEIIRYLNHLKTTEARERNLQKIISILKEK
jgi:hypothetical protein